MQTYNALTFNDLYGVSPRSHFITADGRDLDLRYVMLKNLPEKLKAMGVLFSAGASVIIDNDGYIYYKEGLDITNNLNPQVLVTKKYVDDLFGVNGNWEPAGSVAQHVANIPHLAIGFLSEDTFAINISETECRQRFSIPANRLLAASLYHNHDGRYALIGHTHPEYNAFISETIERLLSEEYSSIEIYPKTLARRDNFGILKSTDPYTIHKDPSMDMVVNVYTLKRMLQSGKTKVRVESVDDENTYPAQQNGIQRDEINNIRDLIEYLHPGLHLTDIDEEVRITWGCSNLNVNDLFNYIENNAQTLPFFTTPTSKIHSSILKYDGSNIAVPVMDFNKENIIDPPAFNSQTNTYEESHEGALNEEGFTLWMCIPETAFISDESEFHLKNLENVLKDFDPSFSDNWSERGFVKFDVGEGNSAVISEGDPSTVKDNIAAFKVNGIWYFFYASNISYQGADENTGVYRFMLTRSNNISLN